ncbi:hypothetical protein Tcan_06272 [Toxocara canis]|uniref:Uncharacterized protein n=1 Tax=Toxocara canis TaxID=6265 RepID=A0A0B2US82_TOXCA|nr:hypothetical protein Tcan_06272 [Toxocara canis]
MRAFQCVAKLAEAGRLAGRRKCLGSEENRFHSEDKIHFKVRMSATKKAESFCAEGISEAEVSPTKRT